MKKVILAGAGPGAADLITLRAKNALESADIIVYAGSLVNPELLTYTKPEAEKYNSAGMNLDEVVEVVKNGVAADKQVVRLHTGDPAMYGAISEQMNAFDELGIEYEIIPGVSSVFAAAAALKCELTMPDVSQSAILTRRAGRTPVPEKEAIPALAACGATMAVFLSIADMDGLVEDFYKAGRSPETPAAVVYRASWPNQQIVRGTLENIASKVAEAGIKRQSMIIVGEALNRGGELSDLYNVNFAHGHRDSGIQLWQNKKTAIYALTQQGALKASEIACGMTSATVLLSESCGRQISDAVYFPPGELAGVIEKSWHLYDAHIFIMATGIVVRKIGRLLIDKISDPAVVCCDEKGDFAVSLIGGHLAGANLLVQRIAGITGGKAVVTTATDVNKITAFDTAAMMENYRVANPAMIKELNRRLLGKEPVDMLVPESFYHKYYTGISNLKLICSKDEITSNAVVSCNCGEDLAEYTLKLTDQGVNVGIGCRRGTALADIENALLDALTKLELNPEDISCIASLDAKRDEAGLLELVKKYRIRIKFYPADYLNSFETPNVTPRAQQEFGVNAVAEAAALAVNPEYRLLLEKQKYPSVTIAIAGKEDA